MKSKWTSALFLLAGPSPRAEIKSPKKFVIEAFETPFSYQVSWKATGEGIVDDLCNRFSPEHHVDYELEGEDMVVTRESPEGDERVRLDRVGSIPQDVIVASVASLVGLKTLALEPLNDGGDLHFILVPLEIALSLQQVLGSDFAKALRIVPPASKHP